MRNMKVPQGGGPGARAVGLGLKVLGGLGALGFAGYHSIYSVDAGYRAVKFNRVTGLNENVFGEGIHFKMPWFEYVDVYDVRTRPRNIASLTGSRDLQMVNLSIRVLHKPNIGA